MGGEEEDFVEYRIYHTINSSDTTSTLSDIRCRIIEVLQPYLRDYIWQNKSFNLNVIKQKRIPCLAGRLHFGDSLEDEWFVYYLLCLVTRQLPDVVATISDMDGDFVLIEAADHLPDWLEPDTSANRVFIRDGSLYIIDIKDFKENPTLPDALKFMSSNPERCLASKEIQKCLQEKVAQFSTTQLLHHARVMLPFKLAKVLTINKNSISPISQAFVHRNPSDIPKITSFSNLLTEGNFDLYPVQVAFTRTQYAHLLCQQIHPPRSYPTIPDESSPDHLAFITGLKLSIGAELAILHGTELEDHELIKVKVYNGGDDSLAWMDVEDGPLMNQIEKEFSRVTLTPEEGDDIVQKMLDEEETEFIPKYDDDFNVRLESFMKSTSGIEGVQYHPDDDDPQTSSGSESEDEISIETEIMETLLHDPDLLMKFLEKSAHLGLDESEFLAKLQAMQKGMDPISISSNKNQKGLADLDPVKLAEARTRSRSLNEFVDDANGDGFGTDDDEEEDINVDNEEDIDLNEDSMSEDEGIIEQIDFDPEKPSQKEMEIEESPTESEPEISDLMHAMDDELLYSLEDRNEMTNTKDDLISSANADSSPAHSLFMSIKRT